jgi:spore germination protein KA
LSKLLSKLAGLFIYKEPANKELGFELLEDANDNESANPPQQDQPPQPPPESTPQPPSQNAPQPPPESTTPPPPSQSAAQPPPSQSAAQPPPSQSAPQPPSESTTPQPPSQSAAQPPPSQSVPQPPTQNVSKPPREQNRKKRAYRTALPVDQWIEKKNAEKSSPQPGSPDDISSDLNASLQAIRQKFLMPKNTDVIIREFNIGRKIKAFMVYLDDMVDKKQLNFAVLPQLMAKDVFEDNTEECPVDFLIKNVIASHQVKKVSKYNEAITCVLSGASALFMQGCSECILIQTFGAETRAINKPLTETVIKGSQEGFTESLGTNISLIRRIIKNENLVVEMLPVGSTNHSQCAVIYLDGVVNQSVVQEVLKRIKKINTGYIAGTEFIEQFIQDNTYMLLPQMHGSERPDRAAAFIMDGLVAIIADGTPSAISVPCTFFRMMHTSEDAHLIWPYATFLRLIRYIGLLMTVMLPALYVAVTLFHLEMIPTELLASIAKAKETVPFPTIFELLIMEISFELVREGAIRVPGVIGQALGIVGALILGQAAVTAQLVSPVVVIVVSLTSLGSFCIPNYDLAMGLRVIRFIFMLAAAFLGFLGISIMLAILVTMACSMKSFGVPYFSPVAPKTKANGDTILRAPIMKMKERPDEMNTPNRTSQGYNTTSWIKKSADNTGGGTV